MEGFGIVPDRAVVQHLGIWRTRAHERAQMQAHLDEAMVLADRAVRAVGAARMILLGVGKVFRVVFVPRWDYKRHGVVHFD